MSCNLLPFSWFDVDIVKKRLHNEKFTDIADFRYVKNDDSEENGSLPRNDASSAWLHDCFISLSPSREILVFCNTSTAVILTSKWEPQAKNNISTKYVLLWSGNLIQDKTEKITSVLCLPLESVGRSSQHAVDWTCVIVGFSSGQVRFYTENGSLMVSELFHDEPVLSLKCHSYRPSNFPGEVEYCEEFIITYHSAVVHLNGFALFQTLRGCRSHLARVKANCGEPMSPPPLAYKKWGFTEQRIDADEVGVTDCEIIGPSSPHLFDHLHQHHISTLFSSAGYFEPRSSTNSMVIATGNHPFVGFHYSTEGSGRQIIYHDVARAVTGRLKETLRNTVSSWLFGGQPTEEKVAVTVSEPAYPMNCRFGFCDPLRKGESVVVTPNRRLSAVTDNLGRIILIDNFKGLAVRLWKGYRDARCGWLEVFEEPIATQGKLMLGRSRKGVSEPSHPLRMAHFLIVHCTRSSILQILSVQKGSKIATIPVPKGSRLLYIKHGIVGTNNVMSKKKRNFVESTCVMIDPSGILKEVTVPFHFALSEESSEKVRDYHLIHRIKKALKNSRSSLKDMQTSEIDAKAEICSLIGELRCSESLMLVLITMATHRHTTAPIFIHTIQVILQRLEKGEDKFKDVQLWSMCQKLLQLLNLYAEAVASFQGRRRVRIGKKSDQEEALKIREEECTKFMTEKLKLSYSEVKDFLKLVHIFRPTHGTKVKIPAVSFEENISLPLVDFLSCFDLASREEDAKKLEEMMSCQRTPRLPISLKADLEEQSLENLSHLLFYNCLVSKESSNDWMTIIAYSGIVTKDLLSMALQTWLSFGWHFMEDIYIETLQRLLSMVRDVSYIKEDNIGDEVCIHFLPWWKNVRSQLSSCKSPFLALLGALTCRALALHETCTNKCDIKEHDDEDIDRHMKEGGWEQVSVEGMAWDKLVHNLEDLAFLEAILSWSIDRSSADTSLALNTVNGRGYVSEVVAQWVLSCSASLDPKIWSPSSLVSFLQLPLNENYTNLEEKKESAELEALGLLRLLRTRFPFSLSASTLIANVCWECARRVTSQTISNIPILSSTLEWLVVIPSSSIRRGVCGLLWTVHLEHRIKAAAQLLECYPNMAAIPDKVVLDEIGLPSLFVLQDLFVCAYKFLDIMTELVESEEAAEEDSERWEEDLLMADDQHANQESCPPPLIELAFLQPPLPPSLHPCLLTLYHQLCLVLCLISRIHSKGPTSLSQPISQLFAPEEQSMLLSASDGEFRYRKEKMYLNSPVSTTRVSFFKKSITSICRSQDYGSKLSQELIALIYRGAELFGLPMDQIRRHHVCELYSCGYDREAEEQLSAVVDKENLSSQLLVIVFQRLKHYLDQSGQGDHRSEVMATFSPAVLARFSSQHSYLVSKEITMKSTEQLLGIILAHLNEESKLYSEALGILDAVNVLASHE